MKQINPSCQTPLLDFFLNQNVLINTSLPAEAPNIKTLSKHSYLKRIDELDILFIDHPLCQAAIALQGAHLLNWQVKNKPSTLWLSSASFFKKGQAIRGGIPICWPWFGKMNNPAHGFARTSLWALDFIEDNDEQIKISLSLKDNDDTLLLWPHSFHLNLVITLSETCEMQLNSQGDYNFTCALHSYFNLSHINNAEVSPVSHQYRDSLTASTTVNDHLKSVNFAVPIDRIYSPFSSQICIEDNLYQRKILLEHYHSSADSTKELCDTVIWNPGVAQSLNMKDMTPDGYQTMGCVESAVISKPIIVSNSAHELYLKISIQDY